MVKLAMGSNASHISAAILFSELCKECHIFLQSTFPIMVDATRGFQSVGCTSGGGGDFLTKLHSKIEITAIL
jgi:hypothetical protein